MATRTHCPYCALQCGMRIERDGAISGDADFPVNAGRLCVKGFTAGAVLAHPERLTSPLARNDAGELVPVSWDKALGRIVAGIHATQDRHGRDAVGVFGSGALTNEKGYLLGKFARVALKTANIDYNGRFCMSSAAAAANRTLGIDRGLPFPLEDIPGAEVVLLVGGNAAETMPPLMRYFDAQKANGGRFIVVDPRRSATAEVATDHLAITPGSDAVLAYGLLHLIIREGWLNEAYVAARTTGFERVRALVASYWPGRVERLTGISEAKLLELAATLGRAKSVMILTGRGPEQQWQGVNNASAYINLALALGAVGKPNSGWGTLTGQGNGQGGREHGQKADQLPGYRSISDPAARKHVARVWGVPEESIPGPGKPAAELLATLGYIGGVHALLVFGSNPVVSAPNARQVRERLSALDFLAVSDFFLSETAALADVVLPSAQWAEEEGTMTNLEGRVIRRRAAARVPEGVRTDLQVLCELAARLGEGERFPSAEPRMVFEELRAATAGGRADYAGISYERIDRESGVFWPCPSEAHPGTPRLFADSFPTPDGRARFHAASHQPTAEEPDPDFPLFLTTGRLLGHYQTRTQTRRTPQLEQMAPRPVVQVHPTTARRHGLSKGADVCLETRRGRARFVVEITSAVRPDTLFAPFHWGGEESVNLLTHGTTDPISGMPEFKLCAARIRPANEMTLPAEGSAA
jgi:assimilatory nitrate reductase catalytic subunit